LRFEEICDEVSYFLIIINHEDGLRHLGRPHSLR
jgi:hypothetical protein